MQDGTQDTRSSESHLSTSHARPATNKAVRTFRGGRLASKEKPPPKCFVCFHPESKHFLADCETSEALSPSAKRQRIFDAKRCLNASLWNILYVSALALQKVVLAHSYSTGTLVGLGPTIAPSCGPTKERNQLFGK